jgi:hypothetical protein
MSQLVLFEQLKLDQEECRKAAAALMKANRKRDKTLRAALEAGHSIRSIRDVTGLAVATIHKRQKDVRDA